jgi:hypothetical protein
MRKGKQRRRGHNAILAERRNEASDWGKRTRKAIAGRSRKSILRFMLKQPLAQIGPKK